MNDEHVFALVETIDGAHLYAIHQLALDATFIDDIGQMSSSLWQWEPIRFAHAGFAASSPPFPAGLYYHRCSLPGTIYAAFGVHVAFSRPSQFGREDSIMTEYTVGLRLGKRSEVLTIEAEDALIAALKVKLNHLEALISYVRKSNRRGDRRNPHRKE
jgi:hypothetical protein